MRVRLGLLIAVLLANPALAEDLANDASDDAAIMAGGQSLPAEQWPQADLVGLALIEGDEAITWRLAVASLDNPGASDPIAQIQYFLHFRHAEVPYQVNIFLQTDTQDVRARLFVGDAGSGVYSYIDAIGASLDTDLPGIVVQVPRALLIDNDGGIPRPGQVIDEVWAWSQIDSVWIAGAVTGTGINGGDRMPDTGFAANTYTIVKGLEQKGTARLTSDQPVRTSNGEATTFLFQVTASNEAEHQDTLEIKVTGAPSTWTVTLPKPTVRVEAGSNELFPVLVTVPFQHQHGVLSEFTVTAQSRSDPDSIGRIAMGIRYTAVPQPSGHHDTVWLHGDDQFQRYINGLEDTAIPEDEQEAPKDGGSCGFSGGERSGSGLVVPLLPGLKIGLDFDLNAVGEATFILASDGPSSTKTYGGYLVVYDGDDRPRGCLSQEPPGAVARIEDTEPIAFDAAGTKTITTTITPLQSGDYIPYHPDQRFALLLGTFNSGDGLPLVSGVSIGTVSSATIEAGSSFRLPLLEYHDPVDEYFATLSGIEMYAATQHRSVNPGKTIIFNITAENLGASAGTFELSLSGGNVDWARVLGTTRIQIPAESTRQLAVAVTAPSTARDGEQADVTLIARSTSDENTQTLIRLVANVDTQRVIADEADVAARLDGTLADKATPVPLLVPLLAVLVGALRRRAQAAYPAN